MTIPRLWSMLAAAFIAAVVALGVAGPAAAVTNAQKLSVLSSFTQTSLTSYNAWNGARLNQGAWVAYGFNWTTDYCSSSPDNPLGFDFRLSCYRHDFGYRNYKEMGQFATNKSRLDSAFHADLQRACDRYSAWVRPACDSLAWTYYQAVRTFGQVAVSRADLERAAVLKADGERRMRVATLG